MRGKTVVVVALALATMAAAPPPRASSPAIFDWFNYSGEDPLPEPGKGEYANPVLTGFYPDPSITRVGDDYYLVTSTFSYFPGLPVFHSRDLVNWTQIGNAIDRPTQLDFKQLGLSRGVFAPTIEHHKGTFYIANTCVDCGGNYLLTAKDPKGPWSDPIWLPNVGGIDPSLFFDDDGRAWILNNDAPVGEPLYEGHRAVWIQEFDPKTNTSFGPRTVLINGGIDLSTKPIWIEGPHIYKVGGYYYLSAAEGGTAEGHSQVILRSRSVTGPYVPGPRNPYLTQRDLPRDRPNPITSAGHVDMVQLPSGDWWATFLAVRPYEGDYYNTGRETFLMPVTWRDGWPTITEPGQVIPFTLPLPKIRAGEGRSNRRNGVVREEFNGKRLGFEWMMMRNPREDWVSLSGGALRLKPRSTRLSDFGNPSFVGRRQQHMFASASTSVRFNPRPGDRAGLAAIQNDEFWYLLSIANEGGVQQVRLERRAGPSDPASGKLIASRTLPKVDRAPVGLRIRARGALYDFEYATRPGDWQALRTGEDGKFLSTRKAGGFVGAVFGLYAHRP